MVFLHLVFMFKHWGWQRFGDEPLNCLRAGAQLLFLASNHGSECESVRKRFSTCHCDAVPLSFQWVLMKKRKSFSQWNPWCLPVDKGFLFCAPDLLRNLVLLLSEVETGPVPDFERNPIVSILFFFPHVSHLLPRTEQNSSTTCVCSKILEAVSQTEG